MQRVIELNGRKTEYTLRHKSVKNINLRIKSDGTVNVSANARVPIKVIESFMTSKADFILNALDKYNSSDALPPKRYFGDGEIRSVILDLCEKIYPYFQNRGVKHPTVKFRRMVSQWGNCRAVQGILTFNTNLAFAPKECIEYVVAHEFTHFLVPNHSTKFYEELAKIMPDYNSRRKILKNISVPGGKKHMLNKLLKSIADQDTAPIVVCDTDSVIVYMNPSAVRRYHRDLTGCSLKDCHNAKSNEMIEKVLAWFGKDKSNNIIFTYHSAKENKDVYMVALRDDNGKLIGYYEKQVFKDLETAAPYGALEC